MDKKFFTVLGLALFATAANGSSPEPEPGLYQVTVGVNGAGMAPGTVQETAEQCITAEDLAADPAELLGDQAGMEGCTIDNHSWGDGKITMNMSCSIEGVSAVAESLGSYNSTSYELTTTMTMKFGDTTIEMQSTIQAERVGDC